MILGKAWLLFLEQSTVTFVAEQGSEDISAKKNGTYKAFSLRTDTPPPKREVEQGKLERGPKRETFGSYPAPKLVNHNAQSKRSCNSRRAEVFSLSSQDGPGALLTPVLQA